MLSSEPQFRTRVSPVIHLPQRAWWFPWAWLKEQELAQAHSSNATPPGPGLAAGCYSAHLGHGRARSPSPTATDTYAQVLPLPPGSQQLISWRCCLGKASPEEEVGSAGRAGLPQPVGADHLIQFPQSTWGSTGQTAVNAQGSLWANACGLLTSISHASSLNTLPLGSSYHGHFKLITCPRFCRNFFSRNGSSFNFWREFGSITGTREYRPSSYEKCIGVVFYSFPEATT